MSIPLRCCNILKARSMLLFIKLFEIDANNVYPVVVDIISEYFSEVLLMPYLGGTSAYTIKILSGILY